MSDANALIYRKQADGTYKWEGELGAVAASYQIVQAETGRPFGDFTLQRAKELLEKGPLRQEWYKVIPIPEKEVSGAAAKAQERKAVKEAKIAAGELPAPAPKAPKVPREKKAPKVSTKKELTPDEEVRIQYFMAGTPTLPPFTREAAIKQVRTEQRIARLADARAAKGPSKNAKLDDAAITEMYTTGGLNANEIRMKLGVAYMTIRLRLIKLGLLVVPAKSTVEEKPAV